MIKNLLKKYLLIFKIRNRFNPSVQIAQRHMYNYYCELASKHQSIPLAETGFRVFSQFEEDGKLLYIFSVIGMKNKTFIEVGSNDGINSNSANLYFNFGWHGLFIDADKKSINRGRYFYNKYPHSFMYAPKFIASKVTKDNINGLIKNSGINQNIGLLSIDIDGNDYWIWDAITIVEPDVIVIESHVEFGAEDKVTPYDANYFSSEKTPIQCGASPNAMTSLAQKKGYKLVGANEMGFNLIYVKAALISDLLPEVTVKSVMTHPSIKEKIYSNN